MVNVLGSLPRTAILRSPQTPPFALPTGRRTFRSASFHSLWIRFLFTAQPSRLSSAHILR
jgi:hypothetical protein